jgi:tetratricopeptide (TPR) repeat protein
VHAETVPYYQQVVALNPNDDIHLLSLGDSHRCLGHTKTAKEEYRQALQLARAEPGQTPQNGSARVFAAYFAAGLGDRSWAKS